MLRYKFFISEAKNLSSALSQQVASDDKGKLHELLLGKHLHPDGVLPEHFAAIGNKKGGRKGTPQEVHDKLRAKIGEAAYNEIDGHAQKTAKAVRAHLSSKGLVSASQHISSVHWTSNRDTEKKPGDHERLTTEKDVNSNADLIIGIGSKKTGALSHRVGISAKYGSQEPNYKNPGAATMEDTAGIKRGTLASYIRPHHKRMEKAGYTGSALERHGQWKADTLLGKKGITAVKAKHKELTAQISRGSVEPKVRHFHAGLSDVISNHSGSEDKAAFVTARKERSVYAEKSALESKQNVMSAFVGSRGNKERGGLIHKTDKELRKVVSDNVSPPTKIPHIVAHSKIQTNGSCVPVVKNSEDVAAEHLADFKPGSLHVPDHKGGVGTTIMGIHKKTGEPRRVAQLAVKSSSGPHKFGPAGTFQLPKYKDAK